MDLFLPNPNDKNKTFIDYVIESSNKALIEKFFNEIKEISNEHLSDIVNKIILSLNVDIAKIVLEKTSKKKFINNQISFEALSLNLNSVPKMFDLAKFFTIGYLPSIKIKNAVKYCRPSFFRKIIT